MSRNERRRADPGRDRRRELRRRVGPARGARCVADPGARARTTPSSGFPPRWTRPNGSTRRPGLADDVMSVVRRRAPRKEAQPGWREALRALFAPVPLAACACTLVVGLVLGAPAPDRPRSPVPVREGRSHRHGPARRSARFPREPRSAVLLQPGRVGRGRRAGSREGSSSSPSSSTRRTRSRSGWSSTGRVRRPGPSPGTSPPAATS